MVLSRRIALLLSVVLASVLAPAAAQAASYDPNGFHLDSSQLYAHENAGSAVITISRSNTRVEAQIRYITLGLGVPCGNTGCSAVSPYDFTPVKGMLDFPAGVASETFRVPIVDHGTSTLP